MADGEEKLRKESQNQCREILAQIFRRDGDEDTAKMLENYDLRVVTRMKKMEIYDKDSWEWFVDSIGYSVTNDQECSFFLGRLHKELKKDIIVALDAFITGGKDAVLNDPVVTIVEFANLADRHPDYYEVIMTCTNYLIEAMDIPEVHGEPKTRSTLTPL